jgi:ribonuclease P protein component
MLPLRYRFPLRRYPDFFNQSQRKTSPHLLMYYQTATSFEAAVIVPQKSLLKTTAPAIVRHKLKRWIQEILLKQASDRPFQLVVVVKPRSEALSFHDLEAEITQLLSAI